MKTDTPLAKAQLNLKEALVTLPHRPFKLIVIKAKLARHKLKRMVNSILHGGYSAPGEK